MLTPIELAREPAHHEQDVVVGVPVAAHQEGERVLVGARKIIEELGKSNEVCDAALYLFLNYPESTKNHSTTRASFAAAGQLAVESRYFGGIDVVPFHAPADKMLIGGIRRTLWNTIEARGQLDSNPVCLSTDIDIENFKSLRHPGVFDAAIEHLHPGDVGSFFGRYSLGSMLGELQGLKDLGEQEVGLLDNLRLAAVSDAVSLFDAAHLGSFYADATFFFKGRLYRKAGGHDPLIRLGESLDLRKRMDTMYRSGGLAEDVGIEFSPRRNIQGIREMGTVQNLWYSEDFPFNNTNEYRNTDDVAELYLSAADAFMNDPAEFMIKAMSDSFRHIYGRGVVMRDAEVTIDDYNMSKDSTNWRALEAVASVVSAWVTALAAEYWTTDNAEDMQGLERRLKDILPKFSTSAGARFCESWLEVFGDEARDKDGQLNKANISELNYRMKQELLNLGLEPIRSWA